MDITKKTLFCAVVSLCLVACGRNEQSPEKNAIEIANESTALKERALAKKKGEARGKIIAANRDAEEMLELLLANDRVLNSVCKIKNIRLQKWITLNATHHERYGQLEHPIKAVIGRVKFTCGMPMSAEGKEMEYYISGAYFPEYEKLLCKFGLPTNSQDEGYIQQFIDIVKTCKYEPIAFKKQEYGDVHFCTESNCNINDFLPKSKNSKN
jgi:hypothetical protein